MKTTVNLTNPKGDVSTYTDWTKAAEDICALESGEGRVSTDILNHFHKMVRSASWIRDYGLEAIVSIVASALGYKVEVTTESET